MSSRNKVLISTLLTLQLMLSAIFAAELATNLSRDGLYIKSENVRYMISLAFLTSAIWFLLTVLAMCGLISNLMYLLVPHFIYSIFLIIFTFGCLVILIRSGASLWPHILASITGLLLSVSVIEHVRIMASINDLKNNHNADECAMRVIVKRDKVDY